MGHPKVRINYAMAASLIAQGVTLDQAAIQTGAKNANSLRCGLARKGVTALGIRRSDVAVSRAVTVATRVVSQASEALRSDFSDILASHVGKLKELPAKNNIKHLKKVAEVLEPLARTAKIVHDWGSQQPNALVVSGRFTSETPQEPQEKPLDIPSVVVSSEPENPQS